MPAGRKREIKWDPLGLFPQLSNRAIADVLERRRKPGLWDHGMPEPAALAWPIQCLTVCVDLAIETDSSDMFARCFRTDPAFMSELLLVVTLENSKRRDTPPSLWRWERVFEELAPYAIGLGLRFGRRNTADISPANWDRLAKSAKSMGVGRDGDPESTVSSSSLKRMAKEFSDWHSGRQAIAHHWRGNTDAYLSMTRGEWDSILPLNRC